MLINRHTHTHKATTVTLAAYACRGLTRVVCMPQDKDYGIYTTLVSLVFGTAIPISYSILTEMFLLLFPLHTHLQIQCCLHVRVSPCIAAHGGVKCA